MKSRYLAAALSTLSLSTALTGCLFDEDAFEDAIGDAVAGIGCSFGDAFAGFNTVNETEHGSIVTRDMPLQALALGANETIEWYFPEGVPMDEEIDFRDENGHIATLSQEEGCDDGVDIYGFQVQISSESIGKEKLDAWSGGLIVDRFELEVREAVSMKIESEMHPETEEISSRATTCVILSDEEGTSLYADASISWSVVEGEASIQSGPLDIDLDGQASARCVDVFDPSANVVLVARFGDLEETVELSFPQ